MSQLIIHKNEVGGVALVIPSQEALEIYSVFEIGLKDTTTGEPFWVVDRDQLPNNMEFFDAWELDLEALGEPSGYGMDYDDWDKEYRK